MMHVSRKTVAATIVVLVALPPFTLLAVAQCVSPEIDALLHRSRAALDFQGSYFPSPEIRREVIVDGQEMLQWLGVKWYGPIDGALFLLDCQGHTLAVVHLGAVEEIRLGPTLPGVGPTVEVRYQPGSGTGYRLEQVELVGYRGNAILRMWKHTAYESAFILPTEDGTEDRYSWSFDEGGSVIHLSGRRSTFPKPAPGGYDWGPPSTHDLPSETFCWFGSELVYKQCQTGEGRTEPSTGRAEDARQ
jgi:hypothetical protein